MLRNLIAGAAVLAAVTPAAAGSLSLSATTGAAACPTVTPPASGAMLTTPACIKGADAELLKIVEAYKAKLGLDPTSTNVQVFQALAGHLLNEIKTTTQLHHQNQARIAAETGVAPVDMQ